LEVEERQLSDRERTVLLLAAEGLTDKEIAKHLKLSQRTIGTYWERIRQKLGQSPRAKLVARFLRQDPEASSGGALSYGGLFAGWEAGVWIMSPQGETLYANRRMATLFGFTQEAFQEQDARNLFQEATSTAVEDVLATAGQEREDAEFKLTRRDGSSVWLSLRTSEVRDAKNKVSAVVLLINDVTVLKRVRHTLESCESVVAFLSQHATDLIARYDSDLRCISMNPAFLSHLKVTKEDVVGKTIRELPEVFQPNDHWVRFIEQALSTGKVQCFECQLGDAQAAMRTYLLPEPSPEFLPLTIMSLTAPAGV